MKTLDVDRATLDVLCRRVGIAGFGVVGPVAYGEAGAGSDVDIRHDLERGASSFGKLRARLGILTTCSDVSVAWDRGNLSAR